MWSFASSCLSGKFASNNTCTKSSCSNPECSDDDASSCTSKEEGLECPICWESFNIVENVPYVLWCGHTLCKNCVLGLQWAVVKFPTVPVQLPFFVSCPWCSLLSLRLVYKGNLTFPRKNYFLLWMVESLNGDRLKSSNSVHGEHRAVSAVNGSLLSGNHSSHSQNTRRAHGDHSNTGQSLSRTVSSNLNTERVHSSLRKSLVFFIQLTAKFPLVILFLLIVIYAIPASAAILALYVLITILFALPSFLILYFAYPSLDWLVREIFA